MQNKFNAAISVHGEARKLRGEDSHSEYITETIGYMGVFDGCGHLDQKRYEKAFDLTGSYLSSRIAALQSYRWFEQNMVEPKHIWSTGAGKHIQQLLVSSISGVHDMIREDEAVVTDAFASSALLWFYHCMEEATRYKFIWAGDARGYILNGAGLAKITADDVTEPSDDVEMLNVLNAHHPFELHQKSFMLKKPCIVLGVTKGAYDLCASPIEFEYMILDALSQADSFESWEQLLDTYIHEHTAKDYTLSAAVFGFDNFVQFKNYYGKRLQKLRFDYINPAAGVVSAGGQVDWSGYMDSYKKQYERYL